VVTNRTKKRQTLTVVVDGRRQRIEVPAGAKAQRSDVPLAKPLRVNQPEKLSVRIGGGGIAAQQTINVNLAPLYGPPADFKCDGDLAEWGSRKAIVLSERGQILPPDPGVGWDGPEDLSAKVYLAADTKALYFAAAVTDDVHTASACRPDNFWNSDSIQIALDPRNDSGDAFDEDDRELGLVLGADGPRAFITHPRPWRRLEVPVRIKREGNQTICEAVFPWDALGTPPLRPGQIIALNFIINDNDGHGRAYWMGLTPGIGEAKVPASYQKFCYEGGKE
jgi:hypothetical protein